MKVVHHSGVGKASVDPAVRETVVSEFHKRTAYQTFCRFFRTELHSSDRMRYPGSLYEVLNVAHKL